MAFDPKDPADVAILEEAVAKAVEPLAAKNKQLLGELKTAKRGAEIDPADHAALEAERDDLAAKLKEQAKLTATAQKAAEDAGKALGDEKKYTETLLGDQGLTAALREAGVENPAHLKGAAALLRSGVKIEAGADGSRVAKIGDKSLADAVKEWAGTEDGKAYVTAPKNGGGGATGSGKAAVPAGTKPNMGGTTQERIAAIEAMKAKAN